MQNFDFKHLETLSLQEQKTYITKYFVPLSNGSHCLYKDNTFEMIPDDILNKVYLKRCGKKLREYYTEDFKDIKTPVYKLKKPLMFEDKINLCPQLPIPKPYKDFTKDIKQKVELFLDYIKEIVSNSNEEVYDYILKWLSNMCKGNKNDSALVFKTNAKGVGKSTLPTMMGKHVIGIKLFLETGSEPIKSKFNGILGGKLLVSFEELETFSSSEWIAVSCILKRQITSDIICLQKKGQDAFEAENINNYMLLSNHDVDDDGRRFFVADIGTHRKGDHKYWDNLYKSCFNDDVGFGLFCYLYEIDTSKFKAQRFPITKNKLNSISKRLDTVYSFLKDEYILKNYSIDMKLVDFYEKYKDYCVEKNKRACSKTDFTSKLSEIQISFFKTGGYNMYKVPLETLQKIASKDNWINEIDEYETAEESNQKISPIDYGLKDDNNDLLERIKALENHNKLLLEENTKLKQNNNIDELTDDELELELEKLLK